MSYNHINTYERGRIEAFNEIGYSTRKIAILLGRHHSTIARELKRIKRGTYNAESAQKDYFNLRLKSKFKGKYTSDLANSIQDKLKATWSPEQIANTITKGVVSLKTIYNWLYQGKLNAGNLSVLRQRGKRRKKPETRGKFDVIKYSCNSDDFLI